MVLKKRLSYGSRGYYLPPIPHIPNTAKGKRTLRRKENPFGAFDLLATIAGNILTGGEPVNLNGAPNCSTSKLDIVKKEPKTESSTNDSGIVISDLNPTKTLIENLGTKHEQEENNNNDDGLVRSNSSNSSSEMPLYSGGVNPNFSPNPNPNLFLQKPVYRNNDDDDENSSYKSFKSRNNSSLKKAFISSLRRVACRNKLNEKNSNTKCYTRKRTQKNMFKRKTVFNRSSHGEFYNKDVKKRGPLKTNQKKTCGNDGYNHVKLSIQSFKVPELFIEIPESSTIETLKKRVMEAVTAVLEGELSIGVMLQGKKIRDDTTTLKQLGIYHNATGLLESLNFTLEPESLDNTGDIVEPLDSIAPNIVPSQDQNAEPVSVPIPVPATPVKSHVSDPEPVHSPMEMSSTSSPVSQAIVPVKSEPLDMLPVPSPRKLKQIEQLGQRRIRRPFSVSEVDALVSAVEQLGTGRWRDVKIRAFDDAKHRTYVDLKDKWKTLVHTATIAPQQRRGEPVPQDLLDRVLAAQAYWAREHSKLHGIGKSFDDESSLVIEKIINLESNEL